MTLPDSAQNVASPKGSTTPRLFTPPLSSHAEPVEGEERCGCGCGLSPSTSWGFHCIEFLTQILGWVLMPWQCWLYVHALERDAEGVGLRFKTLVILIARQNGKTQWLKGLALWKLYIDGAKQAIISAQNLEMAESTLAEVVADVKQTPLLRTEFRQFVQTNGKFKLRLAPTDDQPLEPRVLRAVVSGRKGARSLTVDLAMLDELREHQSWAAWNAITPTTLTRRRSLVVATSNAGDATSVVLASLRNGAIAKIVGRSTEETRTFLAEWSAPEDCNPLDERNWPIANPSLGYLFDLADLRGYLDAKADDIAGWQTEHLCMWVLSMSPSIIPADHWQAGHDGKARRVEGSPVWLSLDVNHERTRAYLAIAAAADRGRLTRPGDVFVETIAANRGTDWIVPWFEDPAHPERLTRFAGIVVQARGAPASGLIESLRTAGGELVDGIKQPGPLNVVELGGSDLTKAYGDAFDLIVAGRFWHRPSPTLDAASAGARARFLGDAWVLDRKGSAVDVSPIIAAIQASWGLSQTPELEPVSAYEAGGLTVV